MIDCPTRRDLQLSALPPASMPPSIACRNAGRYHPPAISSSRVQITLTGAPAALATCTASTTKSDCGLARDRSLRPEKLYGVELSQPAARRLLRHSRGPRSEVANRSTLRMSRRANPPRNSAVPSSSEIGKELRKPPRSFWLHSPARPPRRHLCARSFPATLPVRGTDASSRWC